jgi:hypothetical protein
LGLPSVEGEKHISIEMRKLAGYTSGESLRNSILALSVLYLISWGAILLVPNSVFWDDWLFINDPTAVVNHANQLGWSAFWLHEWLGYSPLLYHLMMFVSFWISGLAFMGILRRIPGNFALTPLQVFVGATIFATAPINLARVSGITLIYSLSHVLFLLAWYLLVRKLKVGKVETGVIVALFVLSFSTNSMLVFFVVPLLHKAWINLTEGGSGKLSFEIFKFGAFGLLAPAWWLVFRIIAPAPYGLYEEYNSLLLTWPTIAISGYALVSLAAVVLTLILASQVGEDHAKTRIRYRAIAFFTLSLFLTGLALFPYVVVGHTPPYSEWFTRHELLMGAGLSLLVVAVIELLGGTRPLLARLISGLMISVSVLTTLWNGIGFVSDWYKQLAIINFFATSEVVAAADLVIVEDLSSSTNFLARTYRTYEWTGQLRAALGVDAPFGISTSPSDRKLLESGYLMELAKLGTGQIPEQIDKTVSVTIVNTCDGPLQFLAAGGKACLSFRAD